MAGDDHDFDAGEPDPQDGQTSLFDLPPANVAAATPVAEHVELAARLPSGVRLGGMSWSYPGWIGHVYGGAASEKLLAQRGLTAYCKHPLLRMVEIDRSFYEPLTISAYASLARQVPEDFRFYIKAHQECTVLRYPDHARYGKRRGQDNPRFLNADYAREAVIAPVVAGLGQKLAGILFQFPPQDARDPAGFARRLGAFLTALPAGTPYAVELRNEELLTPLYCEALLAGGAIHCHNLWTSMPSLPAQAKRMAPRARKPLLVRWLLKRGCSYEDQKARFAPFTQLVEDDLATREEIASLVNKAQAHDVPVHVLVDNKAEGCAPESIVRLSRAIVQG